MFIKVAAVSNLGYMRRVLASLNQTYHDTLQIEFYTELNKLMEGMKLTYFNVILIDQSVKFDLDLVLKSNMAFAWLTEEKVKTFQGLPAVLKYQSQEELYKAILGLASEVMEAGVDEKREYRLITFCSGSGGSGVTSVALAYAKRMASVGNKVFYFNLENLNYFSAYVSTSSEEGMSQALYHFQRDDVMDIGKKLESLVTKDSQGKFFYLTECQVTLDLHDADETIFLDMIEKLVKEGKYTHIVVDLNFDFSKLAWSMLEAANSIGVISPSSLVGQKKTERLLETIRLWDDSKQTGLYNRVKLIYNKCQNNGVYKAKVQMIPEIVMLPMLSGDEKEVIARLGVIQELENI